MGKRAIFESSIERIEFRRRNYRAFRTVRPVAHAFSQCRLSLGETGIGYRDRQHPFSSLSPILKSKPPLSDPYPLTWYITTSEMLVLLKDVLTTSQLKVCLSVSQSVGWIIAKQNLIDSSAS